MGRPAFEAVRSYRKVYGDGHQETLDAIDQLANVHKNMMNYNQALPLAIEALAGRRLVLGNTRKLCSSSLCLFQSLMEAVAQTRTRWPASTGLHTCTQA